ncbi:hypothetical protein KHC33_02150 [Methanospirillum sp. J.3.6.1-F.2.7.3]|uniref:Uncharacterized protein n=1 Tax=Methanospirillum purgamenti TaxID=2834276 RepID=A0A8E7AZW1_9EURY|nr:hypothetical protein [Methanospirillum sp. J.3.6.1-F.2.7.3]QVV89359.1 hypothetical protein KHC33_02150 [Methanospirillum sp. J.3.6.1-F.2.7.3]
MKRVTRLDGMSDIVRITYVGYAYSQLVFFQRHFRMFMQIWSHTCFYTIL